MSSIEQLLASAGWLPGLLVVLLLALLATLDTLLLLPGGVPALVELETGLRTSGRVPSALAPLDR